MGLTSNKRELHHRESHGNCSSAKPWLIALFTIAALSGCKGFGPDALSNGRPAYNAVINATEDEQILSMIVRQRYDDTFGMLAVSSVTANLSARATIGGNVGIGPSGNYAGNLVPFSAEAIYEDHPTITYQPMRGEEFIQRMLAPLTAEQILLLNRLSNDDFEMLHLLVRRVNGIANPRYSTRPTGEDSFVRLIEHYVQLRESGALDIVESPEQSYRLLIHDYDGAVRPAVGAILDLLGIRAGADTTGMIAVPLKFGVGSRQADAVDMETPSALEVIRAVGADIIVPHAHREEGLAREITHTVPPLLTIHSSRERPTQAAVAVMHNDWWFYIDARDHRSKQAFMILRTLIGLRLDKGAGSQAAPILTVPVSN